MATDKDCHRLFETKAVQDIVNNLWRISRKYFVFNYFLSFFLMNYLTLLIMSVLIKVMETNDDLAL